MMAAVSRLGSRLQRDISDSLICASVRNRWVATCGLKGRLAVALVSPWRFPSIRQKGSMKSSKPIRILVVDDHFMVRMGLSASLNVEPDMEVVAEVGNGEGAVDAFSRYRPNLVI